MKQIVNFGDQRQVAQCAYCGSETLSRDHVPSRVLLDYPYPENLPVVPACLKCNEGFSLDEEYVACLIDCLKSGTTSPGGVQREKIRQILLNKPALTARVETNLKEKLSANPFSINDSRIKNLILKLGRGHALFELNEPQYEDPVRIMYAPLPSISDDRRTHFECLNSSTLWPEVGSRAMQRLLSTYTNTPEWILVQPNRYRYAAFVKNGIVVRMVLSEYLACEVVWS